MLNGSQYKLSALVVKSVVIPMVKCGMHYCHSTKIGCSVQGAYRSWKVVEFKFQISQACKVMESGLCPRKS